MKVLDLFSGIGGFSLGLERAGMNTIAFCEIEEFPRMVLQKHWPDVPVFEDVRELTGERLGDLGLVPDVICGGFPCQDISTAGKGAGLAGERSGLWREYARLVGEVRPRYVIVENVAALLCRGLGDVLGDLAALGYDAEWHCIPASYVGAPHSRDRVWIVANARSERLEGKLKSGPATRPIRRGSRKPAGMGSVSMLRRLPMHDPYDSCSRMRVPFGGRMVDRPISGPGFWGSTIREFFRVADGVPRRVDRLRALGNAVVPQIPEAIGRAIMAMEAA